MLILLLRFSFLAVLVISQASFGPYAVPNNQSQLFQLSFGSTNATNFWMNLDFSQYSWIGIGFASSYKYKYGYMYGVDTWIYGNIGDGGSMDLQEWNLGNDTIGSKDIQQDIYLKSYYSNAGITSLHAERLLNTKDRTDQVITLSGTLCFIWAVGNTTDVSLGHNTTNRGLVCYNLGGTTKPPTPAPTYFPSNAPTPSPTSPPTRPPTRPGETKAPTTKTPTTTLSPTTKTPTTTLSPTTKKPTRKPTRFTSAAPTKNPTSFPSTSPTAPPTPFSPDTGGSSGGSDGGGSSNGGSSSGGSSSGGSSSGGSSSGGSSSGGGTGTNNGGGTTYSGSPGSTSKFKTWNIILTAVLGGVFLCLILCAFLLHYKRQKDRERRRQEKQEAYSKIQQLREERGIGINIYAENETLIQPLNTDDDDGKKEMLLNHTTPEEPEEPKVQIESGVAKYRSGSPEPQISTRPSPIEPAQNLRVVPKSRSGQVNTKTSSKFKKAARDDDDF